MTEKAFELDALLSKYSSKPKKDAKPRLIMLYSRPGGGKTKLAGTAVDLPNVKKGIYFDTEGSTEGVITDDRWDVIHVNEYPNAEQIEHIARSRGIDVSEVDPKEERFIFLSQLLGVQYHRNMPASPKGMIHNANRTSYDVIVVDTLDIAQDWAQDYYLDGAGAIITRNGETDTRAGWRNVAKWSEAVANGLNDHPSLGVLVVHNKESQLDSGAIVNGIRLSGSAKDTLPGIPGLVLYLERKVEDGVPAVYATTGTDNRKVTKDRFNLPIEMKNPTIPALFKYIDDKAGVKK